MIALEELAAQVWSLEDRLRRPRDFGCRVLQGCDSACGVGALLKGRSPSRLMNEYCERVCAINVVGDLAPFYSWLPSARNPADPTQFLVRHPSFTFISASSLLRASEGKRLR